jgi:hypothetical protein
MDEHARSMGIEAVRAEVQSCMDEVNEIPRKEPGGPSNKEFLCSELEYLFELGRDHGNTRNRAVNVHSIPRDPNAPCSQPQRTEYESFRVLVDRCLEAKGFKVLMWRE